ncbi:DUF1616 domain-containing protein [Chloroflexota bacterium]
MSEFIDLILHFLDYIPVVRVIISFALVLFLPGFAWTLVFFKKLSILERVTFSFGLSLAIITLSILVLNVVFQVSITGLNAFIVIIIVTVIPSIIYYVNRTRRNSFSSFPQFIEKTRESFFRLLQRLVALVKIK